MKTKTVDCIEDSRLYSLDLKEASTPKQKNDVKDYYHGNLWVDCDYVLKAGEVFPVVRLGPDIVSLKGWADFSKGDKGAIQDFYNPDHSREELLACGFRELSTWGCDIKESSQQMEKSGLAIKYRGGRGYHYGWWILRA